MELHIPKCLHKPPTTKPELNKPLRINICGPLSSIEKLLPDIHWRVSIYNQQDQQPAAMALAQLTFRAVYGREPPESQQSLVVQDEQLGWLNPFRPGEVIYRGENKLIDYYGVTFDHSIPKDCQDPEVLQINIFETEYDAAAEANWGIKTPIDPKDYVPHKPCVYASYRCCHRWAGPDDRLRTNLGVQEWHKEREEKTGRFLDFTSGWTAVQKNQWLERSNNIETLEKIVNRQS